MTVKKERIESIIKRELAPVIQNRLNDPSLKFVSITEVDVTNDFSFATIYVSFLEDSKKQPGMDALNKVKGMLRSEVSKALSIRRTPELIFKLDESSEYGAKIDGILESLKK
ncbi:30S ribosome-binding factor RbfA [Erysipelothrix rhusiopathiae]|uniref:30S ribosome-binding factor RbfA n=1 Tax=Erysipelothrix rhusiopathiae TaxID=1648 RepID=UPI002B2519A6|nr:30S ribosome-binding factor RbfA [Erysipelothrix rhusiopathiae]WRB92361.1 30S ribosome-binding factor RbfA [Erysipelothrix rhusiopathiae]